MLTVHELRRIVSSMQYPDFERQMGPFVLIERPPDEQVQLAAMRLGAKRTTLRPSGASRDRHDLLFDLDNLVVATLPPMTQETSLLVGRLPDCELVVDDPSVSKHHARLTWSSKTGQTVVEDLGSSNGTLLNGARVRAPTPLKDADELSFGSAGFLFLLSKTFHRKLVTHGG